jgi:hypothetical protein
MRCICIARRKMESHMGQGKRVVRVVKIAPSALLTTVPTHGHYSTPTCEESRLGLSST